MAGLVEAFVDVTKDGVETRLRASGEGGVYVRRTHEDEGLQPLALLWCDDDEQATERVRALEAAGVPVWGRGLGIKGLCIRVRPVDLSQAMQAISTTKGAPMRTFLVGNVPRGVDGASLETGLGKLPWKVMAVRCDGPYWVVESSHAPPTDTPEVNGRRLTVSECGARRAQPRRPTAAGTVVVPGGIPTYSEVCAGRNVASRQPYAARAEPTGQVVREDTGPGKKARSGDRQPLREGPIRVVTAAVARTAEQVGEPQANGTRKGVGGCKSEAEPATSSGSQREALNLEAALMAKLEAWQASFSLSIMSVLHRMTEAIEKATHPHGRQQATPDGLEPQPQSKDAGLPPLSPTNGGTNDEDMQGPGNGLQTSEKGPGPWIGDREQARGKRARVGRAADSRVVVTSDSGAKDGPTFEEVCAELERLKKCIAVLAEENNELRARLQPKPHPLVTVMGEQ